MPKYDCAEKIPARVFFEILKSKNYSLLKPKPKEAAHEILKPIFEKIYDYYFVNSDNYEAKELLRLSLEITAMEYKVKTVNNVLLLLFNTHLMPDFIPLRNEWYDLFASEFNIRMDKEKDVLDEIEKVQRFDLGHLNNELNFLKAEYDEILKTLTPSKEEFNYYAALVGLGNAMQGNSLVNADMTLATYVALENEAKRMHREFKKKQNGKR